MASSASQPCKSSEPKLTNEPANRTNSDNTNGHRARRRRPSLWDSREPPYGIPVPPVRGSVSAGGGAGWALRLPRSSPTPGATAGGTSAAPLAVPRVAVRTPQPGETGPLAGIDVAALRAMLGGTTAVAATVAVEPASMPPTRFARRLYVGNLPDTTTEAQIKDFFNGALRKSHGAETTEDPVVSVYLNLEKRFAFIETRTVGEAAAALQLDGLLFQGLSLRMRRPNDYSHGGVAPRAPPSFDPSVLGIVSTQVSDGPNKVFIGGIPYHLSEDSIKDLLQTYGRLAAFNLIKEPNTGLSKGFAFCEYVDPTVVDKACEGLNGMVFDDKVLTVRKASTHTHSAAHLLGDAASPLAGAALRLDVQPGPLLGTATRVLELRNVVKEDELANDEDYKEIVLEMHDEGKKYGDLQDVLVPRPEKGEDSMAAGLRGVGRVFFRYNTVAECERAQAMLSGRKFDENTVLAAFYDEEKFGKRDFV